MAARNLRWTCGFATTIIALGVQPIACSPSSGSWPDGAVVSDSGGADAGEDSGTELDSGANACDVLNTDASNVAICPAEMILGCADAPACVTRTCVDRYEATEGVGGVAVSAAGSIPWTSITSAEAEAACAAAGKRLCNFFEWGLTCMGLSPGMIYPYGSAYDPQRCNGTDFGAGGVLPAGSVSTCEGGFCGLFDMSGNVAEWVTPAVPGTNVTIGGSYLSIGGGLDCISISQEFVGFSDPSVGFRCCLDV